MTDFLIWTHGLRGPVLSVSRGHSTLSEYERKHILSGPTAIADEHAALSLTELAGLYPRPSPPSDPVAAPRPPAPAPSPGNAGAVLEGAR